MNASKIATGTAVPINWLAAAFGSNVDISGNLKFQETGRAKISSETPSYYSPSQWAEPWENSPEYPSVQRYFDLGVYPAGQEVEVSLVLRLDTQVLEQCCKKSVNGNHELFCTRATANLEWDNAISQPAALYAVPGCSATANRRPATYIDPQAQ